MDRSRRETREGHEKTLQYKIRQEAMLEDERTEDKLTQRLEFIGELEQTRTGTAQLQRRTQLFGECKRGEGETSAEFYGKLHHWLERKMPPTKLPLHPQIQTRRGPTK
jgi:hypothetical protein